MGLFRCPKCDAICRTDEEVCHLCGYRLKPIDESKVEEKPKEEKKEEPKVSQKVEISSGFSRKSVFNSVSFDKKEEVKKEEPKEDIFAAYFNQPLDNTEKVEEEPVIQDKVENESIKKEKVEVKSVEAEAVKQEPTKDIPFEKEKVVDVTPIAVTPSKESKPFEQPKEIIEPKVEEKPKAVEQPKVEEKSNSAATNPFLNNGYKPSAPAEKPSPAPTSTTQKKKEPAWVYQWRYKVLKNKKNSKIWAIVFFFLFILSLILVSTDKQSVTYGSGRYASTAYEAKGIWIFFVIVTLIGFVITLIAAIVYGSATLFVKEVEGYHVVVYGYSNDYRLILENREVDRHYNSKDENAKQIKLSGALPNKKIVIATIFYKNYERVIKIETRIDNKNK